MFVQVQCTVCRKQGLDADSAVDAFRLGEVNFGLMPGYILFWGLLGVHRNSSGECRACSRLETGSSNPKLKRQSPF